MPLYCSQGHKNDSSHRFCQECGQRLPLGTGQVLEKRYRIVSQLGQGGFGRTYLAEALQRFSDRCVLKEFAPQVQGASELHKAKELFEREAGVLHQLQHPQLPRFWELFPADIGGGTGCLFLVQDYVEGQTYFDLFKSGKRLSEAEAIQLICQMLPVLSYIHAKGVIHRDISPDNIILRNSDQLPVLIDFGCVKEIAATAVSNFTQLGVLQTRLGKKGYAPEEQLRQGKVFVNSDLYSLAVTALVLLTGKEPQHLYDIYQGNWRWGQDIQVSSQLQAVLQKMLAHKPSDRFSSADEVLQALPSQLPLVTHSPVSQRQTQVVALKANPNPPAPNPTPPPRPFALNTIASHLRTLVVAPKAPAKPVPVTPSPIAAQPNPQPIPKPPQVLNGLGGWLLKMGVGAGLILVTGWAGWAMMSSMIRSVRLDPIGIQSDNTPDRGSASASEQKRMNQLLSRRQDLGIPDAYFNNLVNDVFYTKYPEVRGRTLTLKPEDAALRKAWHNTAEDLLDKLEQAQLSAAARRQLGRYAQRDYQSWQRKAQQGQLGGYTMNQLSQQTDKTFNQLFPEQRIEKLNLQTFGQIWYAIFSDRASQLETGKN
ncbi:serine/threonine-protein kinase [Allocoleopsis franciscana]|nr:serine/threonine-protein kinase [Allocoleopsis franciscana]